MSFSLFTLALVDDELEYVACEKARDRNSVDRSGNKS